MSKSEEQLSKEGNAFSNQGKYEQAIECYDKAISLNPNNFFLYFNKGLCLASLGKKDQAIKCYDQAISLDPNGASAYNNKGLCLASLGKKEQAIECYDKAILLNPNYASAFNNKGLSLSALGQKGQAIKCYDKAISLNPNYAPAYSNKGNCLFDLGRENQAIECFDKAIELNPNFADAYNNKGSCLSSIGKKKEAIECYEKAISLSQNSASAYYNKGTCLADIGQNEEAVKCYDLAISINPNYASAHNNKGLSLAALGKKELAIECYERALSLDPNADTYNNKGSCLSALGKKEQSIECYDKAISLKSDHASAYNNKGNSLFALGRKEEAIECYNKSISLKPNKALYLCNRGKCFNALGKEKEALDDFVQAYDLVQSGKLADNFSSENMAFIDKTLKSITELQKLAAQTEAATKELDQNSPAAKKLLAAIKILKETKNKITVNLIENLDTKDVIEAAKFQTEVEKIKLEFAEQLAAVKEELRRVQSNVAKLDTVVVELKKDFDEIKEEIKTKMDDYHKMVDIELGKSILAEDEKNKVKEYFRAFIETFSSIFVTSQVVESGQVQLDTGSSLASVLSTIASFAPLIGDSLSSGIESLSDFLQTKEIKTNARKMKNLASDPVELSQLVGGSAYEIIRNPKKQQEIIKITEEDLRIISNNLFKQVQNFINKISDQIDVYLYSKLYKTPAARLGHNDANRLIQEWVSDAIGPFGVKQTFVQLVINGYNLPTSSSATEPKKIKKASGKGKCCNMFVVYGIQYDNPLLNQPGFLQEYTNTFGIQSTSLLITLNSDSSYNENANK